VWRLYAENQDVFAAVFAGLRRTGFVIEHETAVDYVHQFLIERAPAALGTFRPDRGNLKGWLFVVFKRFVLGAQRERASHERQLRRFAADAVPAQAEHEQPLDLVAVRNAVAALPADQRRAVRALLRSPAGSVRDVARSLGVSRWRASQVVSEALTTLSSHLGFPSETPPKGVRRILETDEEDREK
jgi:RNA polymerase sigma factor (sigma-70 family)